MLMIFLALTFGQEVGWCPYRTSHLTNNNFTARTDLGKQSPSLEEQWDNIIDSEQRKRWSLMSILYLAVCN
jgi:hypothetical protein